MRLPESPAENLDYRFLSADDVLAAAADTAYELDAALAVRLQFGRDFCFAAWHAHGWSTMPGMPSGASNRSTVLAPD